MAHRNSGLGIASFTIGITAGLLIFAAIVTAGVMGISTPGGLGENSKQAMFVGISILALLLVSVVALSLGIGGLLQKDRKKIFAILGTIFSALSCLGAIAVMLIAVLLG